MDINLLDVAVIAIVLVSGLLAFIRGFVREVLTVAGWIAAGFTALYLFKPLQPYARQYLAPAILADAVTAGAIFVVALVVFSVISHLLSRRVQDSAMGPLDRSLGFIFGLLRGAVVVALGYLLLSWALPPAEHPDWARQARVRPLLEAGGEFLIGLLPPEARQRTRDAVGSGAERARGLQRLTVPEVAPSADSGKESGYKGGERRALDNLFRNNQGQ